MARNKHRIPFFTILTSRIYNDSDYSFSSTLARKINVFLLPYGIPFAAVFADPAVMTQIVVGLDDQIPQLQLLCVFRRNPGKSYLGSYDVPGNRAGGVAVAVVIDGSDQRAVDVPGILESAVYRDGKRLVADPARGYAGEADH